jgi:hypothetical protein
VNETSLRRHLKKHGISPTRRDGELLSPLETCMNKIQSESDVAYSGPLAGYVTGPAEMCGQRILVTSSAKLIQPEQKPYLTLQTLLSNMLGQEQLEHLKGWLKIGYEALANGAKRPGQVLVLAGPRDSYKSVLQNLITVILGGRAAKPYRYMSGATDFNGDLFGAEHLMIEDDIASCDIRSRRNFGARIKEFTVNEVQSCHAKNRQALSLTPFWRVSVSVNDEAENLMILPPLDDSLVDKLLLLKVSKQAPLVPTVTSEERKKFWQSLMDELPGLIWELCNWQTPPEIQGGRFGVLHFHHPDLLQVIEDSAPETRLLALIDEYFKTTRQQVGGVTVETGRTTPNREALYEGTAEDLESKLSNQYPTETRRLLTWANAMGTYLGRLADKHPDRVENCRSGTERRWRIKPRKPVTQ